MVRSVGRQIACDVNGFVLLPANQQRAGVSCWGAADQSGVYLVPVGGIGLIAVGVGQLSQTPIHLTLASHGDQSMQAVQFQAGSMSSTQLFITEYFAPEELLSFGVQEVMKQFPTLNQFRK